MITVHSETHRRRTPKAELSGGELVPAFECPERMDMILKAVHASGHTDIREPDADPLPIARKLHDEAYLDFLATAWNDWTKAGHTGEAIADTWPARRMSSRIPATIEGKLGHYAFAAETSITEGTWEAALSSASSALTAANLVASGESHAFALCRPPGHHAAHDLYGGYCFLNNAGIAAQALRDRGANKVAILDVDFHHGNGTQDVFFHRGDVFFASLHGDPMHAFPYFLGHADETGMGAGEGANLNIPLPEGTPWNNYDDALSHAITHLKMSGVDALVVSFGADTYQEDPISFFKLTHDDFTRLGERIAKAKLPIVTVMEGGYAVEALGTNTVNFLEGLTG